jgi:hypothetical protein
MKRRQKLVLVGLAVVNVLVIGLMATTVIVTMRRNRRPPAIPGTGATPSPCVADLLPALESAGYAPAVTWDTQEARVHLELLPVTTAAVEADPQLLWAALDALATGLPATCRTPRTLTLSLSVRAEGETHHFTGRFSGPSLQAWRAGELSDEEFAAESRFRRAHRRAP